MLPDTAQTTDRAAHHATHHNSAVRPLRPFSWHLAAVLLALALLPRLAAVAALPAGLLQGHAGDAETYWQLADYWLETGVYGGVQGDNPQRGVPDAYLPPLYPALLAGTALLTGHSMVAVNLVQALLGALACMGIYYVAILVFANRRVAWLAFAANALYPIFLIRVNLHLTETLYIFLLTALVLCLTAAVRRYQAGYAFLAGGLLALSLLAREILVFWPPFVALFWLLDRYDWRKKLAALGAFAAGALLVCAPWWARNALVLGRVVVVTERTDRMVGDLLAFAVPFEMPWEGTAGPPGPAAPGTAACTSGAVYRAILGPYRPPGMERSPAETCCRYGVVLGSGLPAGAAASLSTACLVETWLHPDGLWSLPGGLPQTAYLIAHGALIVGALLGACLSLRQRLAWPIVLTLLYGTLAHVLQGALPRYVLPYLPLVFLLDARALVAGYTALRRRALAARRPAGGAA